MLESQVVKRLHVVPGLDVIGNGISVAAHLIADAVGDDWVEALRFANGDGDISSYDEIWVHSCWLPSVLKSCRRALKAGKPLVCMPHGNLDPVRLRYHGWQKRLVGPIERYFLRRCSRIVATCEAEKGWIESYLGRRCPPVETTDIKRFFDLEGGSPVRETGKCIHVLYLGRRHPLKGLEYLEKAVRSVEIRSDLLSTEIELRIVSDAFGEELERVWEWCDVLVLPTLSDNFGLVVAEALERGKRVITTDGAPAWGEGLGSSLACARRGSLESQAPDRRRLCAEHVERVEEELWRGYEGRLIYLKGYRDGTEEERVALLKRAIADVVYGLASK